MNVLIVEDDDAIREVVCESVSDAGYEPIPAASAEDALEFLGTCRQLPAVILLDLMMPRIDGRTLLATLKADPVLRQVPVVVTTALSRFTSDLAECVLHKPFEECHLLRVLRTLTEAGRVPDAP